MRLEGIANPPDGLGWVGEDEETKDVYVGLDYSLTSTSGMHLARQVFGRSLRRRFKIHRRVKTQLAMGGFWYAPEVIYQDALTNHEQFRFLADGWTIEDRGSE